MISAFFNAPLTDIGTINLRLTPEERMSDPRSCLRYTIAAKPLGDPIPPATRELLDGRLFYHEALFRAAPSIISKLTPLLSFAEDRRLSEALKRSKSGVGKSEEMLETTSGRWRRS